MTRNPLWFDERVPIYKASALLDFNRLEAAPVVDTNIRPIGVVTRAACADWQEFCVRSSSQDFVGQDSDQTTVDEISNPAVATVHAHDSVRHVIEKLLHPGRSRVYVLNDDGELIGVVSRTDVLRRLLATVVD
jgi:CBS domain-containing protein